MTINFKIQFLTIVLLVGLVHRCVKEQPIETFEDNALPIEATKSLTSDDIMSFDECSEITRNVLITHCGSCHQSTLTTHKPGAIAIFDLDKKTQWHSNLSVHDLQGLMQRTKNKNSITEAQLDAIGMFVQLKTAQIE